MLILSMTASRRDQIPAIPFDQLKDITHLHPRSIPGMLLTMHF